MDNEKLSEAFAYSLEQYNPFRVTRGNGHDAFWQFLDVGERLGMLDDHFYQAVSVTPQQIGAWAAQRDLPDTQDRVAIIQFFKTRIQESLTAQRT